MKKFTFLLGTALMIIFAGCATQKPATDVEDVRAAAVKGGFLNDYSDLKPAKSDTEAMLNWRNESIDWGTYDKIIIEPVQIWGDSAKEEVNQPDIMVLANYTHEALTKAFDEAPWVELVAAPGPDTAILRFAITNAQPTGNSVLKGITTIVPVGMVISGITEVATDKPAFAGQIQTEFKFLDSMTGRLIAKGVDRRVGGRSLKTISNSWKTAKDALDLMAKIVVYRICLQRGDKTCVEP